MKKLKSILALAMTLIMLAPSSLFASSHREAPITALDRSADVTDWYAFVSYDNPNNVIFILNVDPLLEPANGPNYFPFDPSVLYEMLIDNDQDGVPDVVFQFRFNTEIRDPNLFTGFVGGLAGIPQITSLSGPGSEGLSLIQTYTVTMLEHGRSTVLNGGRTLYAVPSNVGPKTMPDYPVLFDQGIYSLNNGIKVWAGTADDPFFIDLGAFFDSVNFRSGVGPILSPTIDADNTHNYAPDAVGGYNVNSIVLEVPIAMLTVDGKTHPAGDKRAVIGTYGSTSRHQITVRRSPVGPFDPDNVYQQVNREGNSLINEAIIGTGFKDRFSMDIPIHDSQFANFVLYPVAAGVLSSLGVPVPPNPRNDLLLLVQYEPPICPGCGPKDTGPIADLLRLNTGIPATPVAGQKRLGFIAGDVAGYPNGRRPIDDVFDISLRAIEGILVNSTKYGLALGDGVNTKTEGFNNSFPYVMPANSGRDSVHTGPGQAGCTGQVGGICPLK